MRLLLLSACLLHFPAPAAGQTAPMVADSTAVEEAADSVTVPVDSYFHPRQLIPAAALIGTGTVIASTGFGKQFQRYVRKEMADLRGNHYTELDTYLQYAPVTAHLGLGLCGVPCHHSIGERTLAAATAYMAMAAMTNGIKYTVRELRPDNSSRNSFPSGHTATAFTGAELVRREYGPGIGLGAYAVASSVAVMRLYNERHWVGDVLVGAGIGILSANIGYWMLPVYQRWFHFGPCSTHAVAAIPFYQPDTNSAGLSLTAIF